MRLIRRSQYLSVRTGPILGHIKFLNMVMRSGLMRRLNIKITIDTRVIVMVLVDVLAELSLIPIT